ncbi:MAG: peroxiredoxin [Bradyrhizobium sp.]|nr:MAG: peroxiredoxin [Bradyrhizobium sp.]
MVANLTIGDPAPDFDLPTDGGGRLRLSQLRGVLVVFFYPKDDTKACTSEAIAFNRLAPQFAAAGATIIGISPDSVSSHAAFKRKHGLDLTLLADPDHTAIDAYDVWREKSMYGRKYMGVERSTAIVGADGRIAQLRRKVRVTRHAEQTLAAVRALQTAFAKH